MNGGNEFLINNSNFKNITSLKGYGGSVYAKNFDKVSIENSHFILNKANNSGCIYA